MTMEPTNQPIQESPPRVAIKLRTLAPIIRKERGPNKLSTYRLGPLRLIKRGTIFHIHGTVEGKTIRITTRTDDIVRARAMLDTVHAEYETGWRLDESGEVSWREVAKWVCARQRVSAKERGIPFQIDAIDVYREMERMKFRCGVSGIPLTRRCTPNREPDPWSASLDRIENRQGYIQDNFRVVCLAANLAMNRWGYDVLLRLARSVTRSADQVLCDETRPLADTKTQNV